MLDGAGEVGHGLHQLAKTLFDALGNYDLAFARQQLYRAHFAHVHAYRVGCAARFVFHGSEGGGRFGGGNIIGAGVAFVVE